MADRRGRGHGGVPAEQRPALGRRLDPRTRAASTVDRSTADRSQAPGLHARLLRRSLCLGFGMSVGAALAGPLAGCGAGDTRGTSSDLANLGPSDHPMGQERLPVRLADVVDASGGRLGLEGAAFRRAVMDGLSRTVDFRVLPAGGLGSSARTQRTAWGALPWTWGEDGNDDDGDGVANADVFVDVRWAETGQIELEVALQVTLPSTHRARLGTDTVEAFVVIERARWAGAEEGRAAVADALAIAMGVVEARLALTRVDRPRITTLLAGPDEHQVQLVLEWLATNPEQVATWPERGVLAGLAAWYAGSGTSGVASAAVDAVGRIGHAQDVTTLLSRVSLVDDLQALRTYDALSSLGGADAVAFLDFAARNERTLERRRAASRALAAVEVEGEGQPRRSTPREEARASPPARARDRRAELTSLRGHR